MDSSQLQPSQNTIRLVHFSDIHITARRLGWRWRDLLTKRATGWMNLKLGRGRRFRDAGKIVVAMMRDVRERGCDRIIFSGDATTMGYESEFAAAARCLDFTLPGIAVPGNHDVYTRSAERSRFFERFFAPWQIGERIGVEVYPFAQKVGRCWLIGVSSARSNFLLWDARGGVCREQSDRLRELLERLPPGPRILVTHYPLFIDSGVAENRWRLLRDWRTICKIAANGGVSLWLHGHRHVGYVLPAGPEHPFPIVCAGSATQMGRWSYNEYAIAGRQLTMTRRAWNPISESFESVESRELPLAA